MSPFQLAGATFLALTTTSLAQTSPAPTALPNVALFALPNPEPAFPPGFDTFTPPVTAAAPAGGTPAIAEWTRIAAPDRVVALTGSALSANTGASAGKDTQFVVYGQGAGGSLLSTASILRLDGLKAAIVLPSTLPANSEYLLWPVNAAGAGRPVAINATEAWWMGPNAATRGNTVSIFGRNLDQAQAGTTPTSYVYVQQPGSPGLWAGVTAANPYKVDFTVPTGLADGSYQVWIHNGHGGHYGWSGPLPLTVNDGMTWSSQQYNVKDFGAKGDGVTDDQAAIEAAVQAAAASPWSTIYLPAGTYMVSRGFTPPNSVRWLGDGAGQTFLEANAGFVGPAVNDPRAYCLLFSPGNTSNVTVENMTIDANGNLNGYVGDPVYLRFGSDLRFINVNIKAKGYAIGDFHGSTRLSFQNCSLTGGGNGIFFGSATQVFLNNCQVYGTNDVNTMLTFWGGDGVCCTNTTAQDYDNTQPDGWAQGRFFYGSSQWGSNRDFYLGNCTTVALGVRPGYSDQNTGEQVLWESGTKYAGTPTAATATAVSFSPGSSFTDPGLTTGIYDAAIVAGTGVGQHRKITGCNGSTITVSPPWTVMPDGTSTVIIAGVISHCVVYNNTLQGKSTYDTQITASAGIQPYGNSYDFIADGNTISQVRNGIYFWGMNQGDLTPESITPVCFNYVANNVVRNSLNGIVGISEAWNGWPAGQPYPGFTLLANTFVGNTVDTMIGNGLYGNATNGPPGDQFDLTVLDHNTVTNTADAVVFGPDNRILNLIAYKNSLSLGSASSIGSVGLSLGTQEAPALRDNTYTGFATVYGGMQELASAIEAPSHVLAVLGTAGGPAIAPLFSIWNAGTGPLSWTASTDSPWLTVGPASGSTTAEGSANVQVSCSPAKLAPGIYSGTVIFSGGGQSLRYSVNFTVQSPL